MPPRATHEQKPFELHLLVARKGHGTTSTCHRNNESCNIRLPEGRNPTAGVLDLHPVTIVDSPKPYYGILKYTASRPKIPSKDFLHMFTEAYGATLKAENFDLAGDSVTGLFFNYTERTGQRVGTSVFGSRESIVDDALCKSGNFKENPTPCDCGCGQTHHSPSACLILSGKAWDARKKDVSKDLELLCTMLFKDDLMTKFEGLPNPLVLAITGQEVSNRKIRKDLKESDHENTELDKEVKDLIDEKNKLSKEVEGLQARIDILTIGNEETKQSPDQKDRIIGGLKDRILTLTHQMNDAAASASNEKASKEKALEEKAFLEAQVEDLDQRLQAMNSDERSQREKFARKEQDATRGLNKELEVSNKGLRAEVRKLTTQVNKSNDSNNRLEAENETLNATLTRWNSDFEAMKQNYLGDLNNLETQLKDLKSQNEAEPRQNNTTIQTLLRKIQQIALRELVASKERAFINSSLEQARIHINNNQLLLVIQDITALLRSMVNFPMRPTAPEFNNYLNSIMQNVDYAAPLQPVAALRPAKRRRVESVPQTSTAPPRSLNGLNPVTNQNMFASLDFPRF